MKQIFSLSLIPSRGGGVGSQMGRAEENPSDNRASLNQCNECLFFLFWLRCHKTRTRNGEKTLLMLFVIEHTAPLCSGLVSEPEREKSCSRSFIVC